MIEWINTLPNPLVAIVGFIVTILFLVSIHEYGHFWMARRFGVRIEKFSIGFGKPIISWRGKRDNTEYCLAWIPLGGYVKMYGENVSELEKLGEDSHTSHQGNDSIDASDYSDYSDIACDVSQTAQSTQAAQAAGGSFSALPPYKRLLIALAGPAVNLVFAVFAIWLLFVIGVAGDKPQIGEIQPNSVMANTPIAAGDNIVAIDGKTIVTVGDANIYLVKGLGNAVVDIVVEDTNGRVKQAAINMAELPKGSEQQITQALGFNWAVVDAIKNAPIIIGVVQENSAASHAGLVVNDEIVAVNGQPISQWTQFVDVVKSHPNSALALSIIRKDEEKNLTLTPQTHPENSNWGYAGVSPAFDESAYEKYQVVKQYGALAAIPQAVRYNYDQAALLLKTLGRMITGKASIENMGGPITIADFSGKTIKLGYEVYFNFLAAISLTLAVMNLLPIPVLDGGHIVMCLVEMVKGKPLSEKTVGVLMRIGLAVLLSFMLLVISVDLWRYLIA